MIADNEHKPVTWQSIVVLTVLIACLFAMVGLVLRPFVESYLYRRCFDETMLKAHTLAAGFINFAQAHADHLPASDTWEQTIEPDVIAVSGTKTPFASIPTLSWEPKRRFCMNSALSRVKLSTLKEPSQVILFYESVHTGRNASDNLATPPPATARGGYVTAVAFADGHVEEVPPWRLASVIAQSLVLLSHKISNLPSQRSH